MNHHNINAIVYYLIVFFGMSYLLPWSSSVSVGGVMLNLSIIQRNKLWE